MVTLSSTTVTVYHRDHLFFFFFYVLPLIVYSCFMGQTFSHQLGQDGISLSDHGVFPRDLIHGSYLLITF